MTLLIRNTKHNDNDHQLEFMRGNSANIIMEWNQMTRKKFNLPLSETARVLAKSLLFPTKRTAPVCFISLRRRCNVLTADVKEERSAILYTTTMASASEMSSN